MTEIVSTVLTPDEIADLAQLADAALHAVKANVPPGGLR